MLQLQNIVLFRISVRVAVLNLYRLTFTKGINRAKLKDGGDLIEAYSLHTIYAMTPSNIQPCAKKKLRSVPHQKCQYERKCGGNKR